MKPLATTWSWLKLAAVFAREFSRSVWDVLLAVLRPTRLGRSEIVAVPLDVRSDAGISLLANLITLTPGTTTLHVSPDRSAIYVHVMNASGDTVRAIKSGFERRVLEVLP